jgi:hypothetical protein
MENFLAYFYLCKFNFDLCILASSLFSFTVSAIISTLSAVIMF